MLTPTSRSVIFCTLSSAGCAAMKTTRSVDNLIIDEAAATTEAETIIPFVLKPKRMMMVGDPKQLPPMTLSSHGQSIGFARSCMERLGDMGDMQLLDTQYRMHPAISRWPNKQFYGGMLKDGVSREEVVAPFTFLDTKGKSKEAQGSTGSYKNEGEALVVVRLLRQLMSDWHEQVSSRNTFSSATNSPGPELRRRCELRCERSSPNLLPLRIVDARERVALKSQPGRPRTRYSPFRTSYSHKRPARNGRPRTAGPERAIRSNWTLAMFRVAPHTTLSPRSAGRRAASCRGGRSTRGVPWTKFE